MTTALSSNPIIPGRVAVLGAGASGSAAARLARSRGSECVTVYDTADEEKLSAVKDKLYAEGIALVCGEALRTLPRLHPCDTVVFSPGIPLDSPLGLLGRGASKACWGELGFAAQFCPLPLYAVTGTNGKTTTTELFTACLNAAGSTSLSGGNIGLPLSQIVLDGLEGLRCVVVEVSSFQMELSRGFSPDLAILLNITPDHLNRHGSFDAYRETKLRCLHQVKAGGHLVINGELETALGPSPSPSAAIRRFWSSPRHKGIHEGDLVIDDNVIGIWSPQNQVSPLVTSQELLLKGGHNLQNAAAVIGAMQELGYALPSYLTALKQFKAGPHRLEEVADLRGIRCIDDSKATDVDALIKALEALGDRAHRRIHLIAGGLDKGCDLSEALPYLERYVADVFLIGACKERLARSWGALLPCTICTSMEEAVEKAFSSARSGELILLSPACASMDMFKNYEERGNFFADACKKCGGILS